jgi:hypothetical protein
MKTSTLITMLVGIGVAGVATFASPSATPAVAAGFGGSLCGATLLSNRKKDEEAEKVESARVAKTFSFLYETNRGMISPEQLAFNADIVPERAAVFLDALADEQRGQVIETAKGRIYNFPHPINALDELTKNANAWAEARCQPLLQEIGALQHKMTVLQAQAAVAKNGESDLPNQVFAANNNQPQAPRDPWNNLL